MPLAAAIVREGVCELFAAGEQLTHPFSLFLSV
jgi:hypothetical protein